MKLFDLSNEEVVATEAYVPNEDMVEEITNLQNEIVMSCEAMTEGLATVERLETMLASHENLPKNIKSDVAYCNVATENISMVCANIGLTPSVQVSVESIDDKELGSLSTEDIKDTIQKIINAIKKMFLKVAAKIKQFITKLVHNGRRLDARLDAFKKIVNDSKAEDVQDEKKEILLKKLKKFTTLFSAALDDGASGSLTLKQLDTLISFSSEYKNVDSSIEVPEELMNAFMNGFADPENEDKIWADIVKRYEHNYKTLFGKLLHNLAKNKIEGDDEKKIVTDIKIQPIRVDGDVISGMIYYMYTKNKDKEPELMLKFMSFKCDQDRVFHDTSSEKVSVPDLADVKKFISGIEKPSSVLSKLSKGGEEDLDTTERSIKRLEEIVKDDDSESVRISSKINEIYSIVPKVVNGNIINYYNNIVNILDLFSAYIVVKK